MMQVLGAKRVSVILLLLAIGGLLGYIVYLYFVPANERLENELRSVRSEISVKREETSKLREDYIQIQDQRVFFEDLSGTGFFTDQNRVVARKRIEDIQKFTHILSASYDIQQAVIKEDPNISGVGHVVLESPVKMTVKAFDDVDIYNFIYWIENAFPGQVSFTAINIQRSAEISDMTLRQISNGVSVSMAQGDISFIWRTVMPKDKVGLAVDGGANAAP